MEFLFLIFLLKFFGAVIGGWIDGSENYHHDR